MVTLLSIESNFSFGMISKLSFIHFAVFEHVLELLFYFGHLVVVGFAGAACWCQSLGEWIYTGWLKLLNYFLSNLGASLNRRNSIPIHGWRRRYSINNQHLTSLCQSGAQAAQNIVFLFFVLRRFTLTKLYQVGGDVV